jgi:hypothetical protein
MRTKWWVKVRESCTPLDWIKEYEMGGNVQQGYMRNVYKNSSRYMAATWGSVCHITGKFCYTWELLFCESPRKTGNV